MTLGFNALAHRYQITPVQPLRVISVIGSSPQRNETPTLVQAQFPSSHQPADTVEGQFEFGLKYEEIHLEFFAKLFAARGPEPIEDWCQAKPLRQYARRTGFFYEWLTGLALDVPAVTNGAYVDAVAPGHYLTSVLDAEFGSEMLLRSASWLTFKESQASFTI